MQWFSNFFSSRTICGTQLSPRTTLLQENSTNQMSFDLKFGKKELTQMWHEDNACEKL